MRPPGIREFYAARLVEDDDLARDAGLNLQTKTTAKNWTAVPDDFGRQPFLSGAGVRDDTGNVIVVANGAAKAAHTARHDPARIRAQVAAGWRLLARHSPLSETAPGKAAAGEENRCHGCGDGEFDVYPVDIEDCPELQDAVAPWAEHPDFDTARWLPWFSGSSLDSPQARAIRAQTPPEISERFMDKLQQQEGQADDGQKA